MTGLRLALAAALGLALAAPAGAGVYFTDEVPQPVPTDFQTIKFRLFDLQSVAPDKVAEKNDLRTAIRDRFARLLEKEKAGTLTLPDRIDLGAAYLHLSAPAQPRYREAKRVLEEAERLIQPDSPYRFLLLANLATTYQGLAETEQQATYYDQAINYQKQALKAWPEIYPGWLLWQGQNFRRAELYYLRLLEARRAETRKTPGPRGWQWQGPDDLFDGVSFVGLGDRYEAGRIPTELWDKLPPDAPQLVAQLVFWAPRDDRLYWLLGEVLNSRNQVVEAYTVFDELLRKRNVANRELMLHRRALEDPALGRMKQLELLAQQPTLLLTVVQAATPLAGPEALGPGPAAIQAVLPALISTHRPPEVGLPNEPGSAQRPPAGVQPPVDWQAIAVGFVSGAVVAVLVLMQIRQWRQRRGDSINERRLQQG